MCEYTGAQQALENPLIACFSLFPWEILEIQLCKCKHRGDDGGECSSGKHIPPLRELFGEEHAQGRGFDDFFHCRVLPKALPVLVRSPLSCGQQGQLFCSATAALAPSPALASWASQEKCLELTLLHWVEQLFLLSI